MGDRAGCNTMSTQFLSLVITGSKYIIDREGCATAKRLLTPPTGHPEGIWSSYLSICHYVIVFLQHQSSCEAATQ